MEFSPGLRGVVAGETSISTVGKEGTSLRYRGYDAIELTKNNTYEEVASLIIKDSLDGTEFKEAFTKFYNAAIEDEALSKYIEEISSKSDSEGTYSLEYLNPVVKAVGSNAGFITCEFSSAKPLRIEFKVANIGRIHFYLAPRVES